MATEQEIARRAKFRSMHKYKESELHHVKGHEQSVLQEHCLRCPAGVCKRCKLENTLEQQVEEWEWHVENVLDAEWELDESDTNDAYRKELERGLDMPLCVRLYRKLMVFDYAKCYLEEMFEMWRLGYVEAALKKQKTLRNLVIMEMSECLSTNLTAAWEGLLAYLTARMKM